LRELFLGVHHKKGALIVGLEAVRGAQSLPNRLAHLVMVEAGRYALAWVGFAQHDAEQSIKAVARAGDDRGYLEHARISWADAERGRGPTGRAFRTQQIQISRNMQTDPSLAPWREAVGEAARCSAF
jgi:hypothetical protein